MISAKLHNGIERVVFTLYLVLLFSLGFMKPTLESPFAALTPTDLIFPLVFACWLGSIFIGVFPFKWNNAYWAFLLYLSALLISAIFSNGLRELFGNDLNSEQKEKAREILAKDEQSLIDNGYIRFTKLDEIESID
jgi:hypothetical protein